MLIVSKFHDYYDSALGAAGVDKTIVYERKMSDNEHTRHLFSRWSSYYTHQCTSKKKERFIYTYGAVGFCGEWFPFVRFHYVAPDILPKSYLQPKDKWFYDLDELLKFIEKMDFGNKFARSWYSEDNDFRPSPERAKTFFEVKRTDVRFREHNSPIVVWDIRYEGTVVNPKLEDYQFQTVKDPFTAFQDISMYISGVLGTKENDMITISDEDKRDKHGFDEWSFKNMPPGTKKQRRKENKQRKRRSKE